VPKPLRLLELKEVSSIEGTLHRISYGISYDISYGISYGISYQLWYQLSYWLLVGAY